MYIFQSEQVTKLRFWLKNTSLIGYLRHQISVYVLYCVLYS